MIKRLNSQIVLYLFFGALNTIITFALYIAFIKVGTNYLLASSACYIVGIVEGFIFNGLFVFKQKLQLAALSKYSLVYIVSYIISIFILYCFVEYLGVNEIIAQAIVIIIVTLLNFKLVEWLVFNGEN